MDRNRIIKFLDSLEEQGILAPGQQSVVLRAEMDDVVAGSNLLTCTNRSAKVCTGKDNANNKCTNIGKDACVGSTNNDCDNPLVDTTITNLLILACKSDT